MSADILGSGIPSCLRDKHCSHRIRRRAAQSPLSSTLRNTELCADLKRRKPKQIKKRFKNVSISWKLGVCLHTEIGEPRKCVRAFKFNTDFYGKMNERICAKLTVCRITSTIRYSQFTRIAYTMRRRHLRYGLL